MPREDNYPVGKRPGLSFSGSRLVFEYINSGLIRKRLKEPVNLLNL